MSKREFTERDIHMALDGELPDDECAAYARWLEANPDMDARSRRFAADRELLRQSLSTVTAEPVPDRLERLVSGQAPRRTLSPKWRMAAAAAILFAAGAGSGYFLGASGWGGTNAAASQLAESAMAAHTLYAAEKLHVVEIGADQKQHLVDWLSKRVGLPLVAPDLSPQGFELVGGRLLPARNKAAAQFMYQDHAGNRVSLYIVGDPSNRETGFRLLEEGDTRALYWLDDGYGCAVAGTLPQDALTKIADAAYRQILEGMKD